VTRNSVIVLLRESGVMVEERQVSMDEITDAYDNGQLREVFGSGTAASVSFIRELSYKGKSMSFDPDAFETALALRTAMTDIKEGRVPDNHGWMLPV
jgi:branched-chain amino acid aminotransferase